MKFRKDAVAKSEPDGTREEVREMAEAFSLYRSAMRHIADREAARPFAAERRAVHAFRFRLLLAPALTAAFAAAVLAPVYSHFHGHHTSSVTIANITRPTPPSAHANVDDTALMNQIDSELSEDVPDALQPLADLSDQTTNNNSVTEKTNATQE